MKIEKYRELKQLIDMLHEVMIVSSQSVSYDESGDLHLKRHQSSKRVNV